MCISFGHKCSCKNGSSVIEWWFPAVKLRALYEKSSKIKAMLFPLKARLIKCKTYFLVFIKVTPIAFVECTSNCDLKRAPLVHIGLCCEPLPAVKINYK